MLESTLTVVLLIVLIWGMRRWQRRGDPGWLPRELRRATLAYAEQHFRAPGPVCLTAKVDRVYRRADGLLVLVELKTRRANRPYPSDVIELSAQRVALMAQTSEAVASRAYVVVQGQSGRRAAHPVTLLEAAEVHALAQRREAILDGRLRPRRACAPSLCSTCGFEKICTNEQLKKGRL